MDECDASAPGGTGRLTAINGGKMRISRCCGRAFTFALGVALCASASRAQTIPYAHAFVDANPGIIGGGIVLGDIDGDGFPDVILAGGPNEFGQPMIFWYKNPGIEGIGNWQRIIVDDQFGGTDDVKTADIRGNGILDIVTSDQLTGQIVWYENPANSGGDPAHDNWVRHIIGNGYLHDMAIGDVFATHMLAVVTHGHFDAQNGEPQLTVLYIQNNPDSWTPVVMVNAPDMNNTDGRGKGIALANLAGHEDGRLDLVENGFWLEQPANLAAAGSGAAWTVHTFDSNAPEMAAIAISDINGDGRLDIVMSASDGDTGPLAWYEQGAGDPRDASNWTQHIIDGSVTSSHMLAIADLDGDGQPDVVFGEPGSASARFGFFLNNNHGNSWTLQLLSTSPGGRPVVGDLGRDGDLDIVSTLDATVPIDLWSNQTK